MDTAPRIGLDGQRQQCTECGDASVEKVESGLPSSVVRYSHTNVLHKIAPNNSVHILVRIPVTRRVVQPCMAGFLYQRLGPWYPAEV